MKNYNIDIDSNQINDCGECKVNEEDDQYDRRNTITSQFDQITHVQQNMNQEIFKRRKTMRKSNLINSVSSSITNRYSQLGLLKQMSGQFIELDQEESDDQGVDL